MKHLSCSLLHISLFQSIFKMPSPCQTFDHPYNFRVLSKSSKKITSVTMSMSMTGFAYMLHTLALLVCMPSHVSAADTCDLVCQDQEFLHNSCYGEVCVLLQPGYDRGVMPETQGGDEALQVKSNTRIHSSLDVDIAGEFIHQGTKHNGH